jgi:hypothetical protein
MKLGLALALGLGLAVGAMAGDEVTLSGKVVCAKCTLKSADAKDCADVLVVSGEKAGEYHLVKNETTAKFGHTCKGEKAAKVKGTVTERDGKKWLTASSIEAAAS